MLYSVQPLSLGPLRTRAQSEGAYGSSFTAGSKEITYLGEVVNGARVSWKTAQRTGQLVDSSGAVYALHVYSIHATGLPQQLLGAVDGYAVPFEEDAPGNTDVPFEEDAEWRELLADCTDQVKVKITSRVKITGDHCDQVKVKVTSHDVRSDAHSEPKFKELWIHTIPVGGYSDARVKERSFKLSIEAVEDATLETATPALLKAVVAFMVPILRGHYLLNPDLLEPTLLRFFNTHNRGEPSFRNMVFFSQRYDEFSAFRVRSRKRPRKEYTSRKVCGSHQSWGYDKRTLQACQMLAVRCMSDAEAELGYPVDTVTPTQGILSGVLFGYRLKIVDGTRECRLNSIVNQKKRTVRNVERAIRQARGVQRRFFEENVTDWIELAFQSDAAFDRFRASFRQRVRDEGCKRAKIDGENKRYRYVPMPPTAATRTAQAEVIARHGVRSCRRLLRSEFDGTLRLININESFDAVKYTEIGLAHDIASWISLYICVMFKEGHLVPNLQVADTDGCVGKYDDTWIGLWGDATDGTGKVANVSQAALVLIDPNHRLIKGGRSVAMMHSIWLEHEDYFNQLLELEVAKSCVSGPEPLTRIVLPPEYSTEGANHYLEIKMTFRRLLFIADNKAYAAFRGKVAGSGICRLHLLQPLPISLSDCVGLYRPATVVDNLIYRVETLHMAMLSACLFLHKPLNNSFFTKAELVAELTRLKLNKNLSDCTAEELVQVATSIEQLKLKRKDLALRLTDLYKQHPMSWKDVDWSGIGTLLPAKLDKCVMWARKLTGMVSFPVGSCNNAWALQLIIDVVKDLFVKAHRDRAWGFTSMPEPGDLALYVSRLLDIDDISTGYGRQGFRARTIDKDMLSKMIADPRTIPKTQGIDLSNWKFSMSVDHGRKGMFDMLTSRSLAAVRITSSSVKATKASSFKMIWRASCGPWRRHA